MKDTYLYQINVTRDCNLRCTHCYIHSDVKDGSLEMSTENVFKITKDIVEHMRTIKYANAEIHLIGGEPTLLGLQFFEDCIPKMRAMLDGNGFSYSLILVSNLLSKDIVAIAKLFDRVSTSYEPVTRFPKKKLEQMWMESVNKLTSNGINLALTTAMTKPVLDYGANKLLDFIYGLGVKQVHFGFFIPEGDGLVNKLLIFPEFIETSNFLIDTAEWYLERRVSDPDLYVNPFESMLMAVHTDEPMDDIVCPIVSGSIDINWDGKAATCLEAGGALEPEWLGNVFTDSIMQVAASQEFSRKVAAARKPQRACASCEDYRICRSGCGVLHNFWNPTLDKDCPGFRKFIKYVQSKYADGIRPKQAENG